MDDRRHRQRVFLGAIALVAIAGLIALAIARWPDDHTVHAGPLQQEYPTPDAATRSTSASETVAGTAAR